ncbi:alpha/beta hydrolase [Nocardia sp. GCM10030253]|uniref:alpha/beta hydrolase n=1 Tax=Nocardia sp. GCM10030253 TaxID=3273404 RepID=UPI003638D225
MTGLTYDDQPYWRNIQRHLPERLHLVGDELPSEEQWAWRGHSVHIDRYPRPAAPVKLVQLHGVGTNGRMMTTIVGAPMRDRGVEPIGMDLLGYGQTTVAKGHNWSYGDWIDQVVDFLAHERTRDDRPIVLYGLSAGGMLAYQVAAIDQRVAGIVGTCFMDQQVWKVRWQTARFGPVGACFPLIGGPLTRVAGVVKVPVALAGKMKALVNSRAALRDCLADPTSAGNWVSVKFLDEYMNAVPATEPEDFAVCPILLTQPTADRWTPLNISTTFLDRVRRVPVTAVMLDGAGHYPLEEPALTQLPDAIDEFCRKVG